MDFLSTFQYYYSDANYSYSSKNTSCVEDNITLCISSYESYYEDRASDVYSFEDSLVYFSSSCYESLETTPTKTNYNVINGSSNLNNFVKDMFNSFTFDLSMHTRIALVFHEYSFVRTFPC